MRTSATAPPSCANCGRTSDVTVGSEILREIREFERGTTAALNGYVQPVIDRYVSRLTSRLSEAGFDRELLIMQGNGGTLSAGAASRNAVQTVMSGPAGGAIAAARIASAAGFATSSVVTWAAPAST